MANQDERPIERQGLVAPVAATIRDRQDPNGKAEAVSTDVDVTATAEGSKKAKKTVSVPIRTANIPSARFNDFHVEWTVKGILVIS